MVRQRREELATKADLAMTKVALEAQIAGLRTELVGEIIGIKGEVSGMKTNVRELKTDVSGLKTDVSGLKTIVGGLKAEVGDLKAGVGGLKGDVADMRADIRRLMISDVDLGQRISDLKEHVNHQFAAYESNILRRFDGFADRLETIWRESAVFPKLFDEQGATLLRHETRISALESRRTP